QPLAERRGIHLSSTAESGLLEADQARMTQLLINLIENALRHTSPGGSVRVTASLDGGAARVSVSDTGCGIAPEHLPHIFDRFYRVDTGRARADGGSGLGLSICRWIAEAHRGSLVVTSETGRGSTFTLRMPRFTLASSSPHKLGTLCVQLLFLLA